MAFISVAEVSVWTVDNRTAKLNQERAAQSCTDNVVKNNGSNAVKGEKKENGIF